jgi:OPA family glycerol-3-phosphate transporter-like MFS transporter
VPRSDIVDPTMTAAASVRPTSTLASLRATTLFVLWTTYGSFYFCRVNFGPAVPSIRQELGFTALEIGFLLGAVKIGYALGQLVNGQLTERLGARRILGVGMLGSSAMTLFLAAAPTVGREGWLAATIGAEVRAALAVVGIHIAPSGPFALMLLLAFTNGWFQAAGWPPCVKIAGQWFPVRSRGRTMGMLGTSLTIGSALALLVVGALLQLTGGSWRSAFVITAFVLAASFVHMALRLREYPPDGMIAAASGQPATFQARMSLGKALGVTVGNGRIWVLAFGLFGLDAVRYGFLDWAPGHLAEVHGTGVASAALKTAVFPLAGALGALSSGRLSDRYFQSRRAPVCAIFLASVGLLTLAYRAVVSWGTLPTVTCLALVGFFLYGAQILLVGTAAQDFARRGATAAAAGFVDFIGHVGAFSGDVVTAWMLKHHGWGGAIGWWAAAGLAAAALVATLWRARPLDDTEPPSSHPASR